MNNPTPEMQPGQDQEPPQPDEVMLLPELNAEVKLEGPRFLHYWDQTVPTLLQEVQLEGGAYEKKPRWAAYLDAQASRMLMNGQQQAIKVRHQTGTLLQGEVLPGHHSYVASVDRWYRSLGPTADLSDAVPTLLTVIGHLQNSGEVGKRPQQELLSGMLFHEISLVQTDAYQKVVALDQAKQRYENILKADGDWSESERRDAARFRLDVLHEKLDISLKAGIISRDNFDNKYNALQSELARNLLEIARPEYRIQTGELFEWSALLLARHVARGADVHDRLQIRNALYREDKALYPWSPSIAPIWSYDLVAKDGERQKLYQLKTEDMSQSLDRPTNYLPIVTTYIDRTRAENQRLRMIQSAQALTRAYAQHGRPEDAQIVTETEAPIKELLGI